MTHEIFDNQHITGLGRNFNIIHIFCDIRILDNLTNTVILQIHTMKSLHYRVLVESTDYTRTIKDDT